MFMKERPGVLLRTAGFRLLVQLFRGQHLGMRVTLLIAQTIGNCR